MRIDVKVNGSANEWRRLGGQPDLLPLIELAGAMLERWLQARVLAAAETGREGTPTRHEDASSDVGKGAVGQEIEAHGRHPSDRG